MDNRQALKETFQVLLENHLNTFPNSVCGFKTSGLCDKTLYIETGIFSSELHGCTIHNDPFHTMFAIEQIKDDLYELTIPNGFALLVKPFKNESHLAFSKVKLNFRKVKGDAKKIIAKVKELQAKQLKTVQEWKAEIKNFEISNLKNI